MGRERVAEEVAFLTEPACRVVRLLTVTQHRHAVGRVAGDRGPTNVQPVVNVHLHFRTELPQGQAAEVVRVLVLRFPDLEITEESLRRLDAVQPLAQLLVIRCDPRRRHRIAVMVLLITDEAQPVAFDIR